MKKKTDLTGPTAAPLPPWCTCEGARGFACWDITHGRFASPLVPEPGRASCVSGRCGTPRNGLTEPSPGPAAAAAARPAPPLSPLLSISTGWTVQQLPTHAPSPPSSPRGGHPSHTHTHCLSLSLCLSLPTLPPAPSRR